MRDCTVPYRHACLVAALLAFGGVAAADSFVTAPALDIDLGGSIWASASSTPADALFAGMVYQDVIRNGSAYDRNTLWVGFYTDIYIAETYGSQSVEHLSEVLGSKPRTAPWIDRLLDPSRLQAAAEPADQGGLVTTTSYDEATGDASDD
jgi:hypothetical protein